MTHTCKATGERQREPTPTTREVKGVAGKGPKGGTGHLIPQNTVDQGPGEPLIAPLLEELLHG